RATVKESRRLDPLSGDHPGFVGLARRGGRQAVRDQNCLFGRRNADAAATPRRRRFRAIGEDVDQGLLVLSDRLLMVERVREVDGPDADRDCGGGGDCAQRGGGNREALPERDDVRTLGSGGGQDPVLERLGQRRQVDVVGQRACGRAKRRNILAAALAAGEMRLVRLEVVAVERVERVGGGELVGRTVVHSASREGYHRTGRLLFARGGHWVQK